MKTITLSDEDYEFLKDLQHELNTQETDHQADPRYWGVMETREVAVPEGCGDPYIYMGDGVTDTLEEAVAYVDEIIRDYGSETAHTWYEMDKNFIDDVADFIHDHIDNTARVVYMEEKPYISHETGAFLTKRACKKYIEKYGYNHSNPRTYGMTAYRNPELERLLNILKSIDYGDNSVQQEDGNTL